MNNEQEAINNKSKSSMEENCTEDIGVMLQKSCFVHLTNIHKYSLEALLFSL